MPADPTKMPIGSSVPPPSAIRQTLKTRRASVQADQRCRAEARMIQHLNHWSYLAQCESVACYLSVNSEFPTSKLIQQLHTLGKHVYLPLLDRSGDNRLTFQKIQPREPFQPNRFGIPEPLPCRHQQVDAENLDLIILPLVGFNKSGVRMGMGGGFYDRTLAFAKNTDLPQRPFLLGLAFACQQEETLTAQPWDVPLEATLTEEGFVQ